MARPCLYSQRLGLLARNTSFPADKAAIRDQCVAMILAFPNQDSIDVRRSSPSTSAIVACTSRQFLGTVIALRSLETVLAMRVTGSQQTTIWHFEGTPSERRSISPVRDYPSDGSHTTMRSLGAVCPSANGRKPECKEEAVIPLHVRPTARKRAPAGRSLLYHLQVDKSLVKADGKYLGILSPCLSPLCRLLRPKG